MSDLMKQQKEGGFLISNNLPIHKLVEKTQFSKSTLTFHLDNLEKAGLIRRDLNKEDRREILIKLTEKNEVLQKDYVEISKEMTNVYYNKFTDKEIKDFEDFLNRILKNLIDYEGK
ncbi:MAG: MarR family winged helix-turn-helix transcriptional regulator [Promethearchaeota archaeon]|jgi:DNA-binding MarR family transcriptional regulator